MFGAGVGLSNVFPRLATYDLVDGDIMYAVQHRESSLCPASVMQAAYLSHHIGIQPTIRFRCPKRRTSASLRSGVQKVIRLASQEKMIRSDARSHIAPMQHRSFGRYLSMRKCPRRSMCSFLVAVSGRRPVAVVRARAAPQPARLGFLDGVPEAFLKQQAFSCVGATARTVPPAAPCDTRLLNLKRGATVTTRTLSHVDFPPLIV